MGSICVMQNKSLVKPGLVRDSCSRIILYFVTDFTVTKKSFELVLHLGKSPLKTISVTHTRLGVCIGTVVLTVDYTTPRVTVP